MKIAFTDAKRLMREWPEDLRQALGERRLIELALEAAHIIGEGLPRPEAVAADQPSPRMLLTLLTYCYAAGIYASEDIEWESESDAGARYICANVPPEQDTVRRFRRANRPWVEACLAWVYGQAFKSDATSAVVAAIVREKVELAILADSATADC